ncbi:hypothetical protein DPMN_031245 [Dreissena polymorpha]|uniref:Uncharacterized protein n=1 Tax=Dreissena polymorpha TaxID=45954 RepID=A0A9D4M487_DREPO|nr:hypothetical protein DPMN_031245 [Dreissena polymorpha]
MDTVPAQRPGGHGLDHHHGSVPQITPKTPSTASRPRKRTRQRLYSPQAFDKIEPK